MVSCISLAVPEKKHFANKQKQMILKTDNINMCCICFGVLFSCC